MLLDRRVDTLYALITNVRAVWLNPLPMALWAVLVILLVTPALVLGMVGLLVAAPIVGHGTWHAYRSLVGEPPPDEPDRR